MIIAADGTIDDDIAFFAATMNRRPSWRTTMSPAAGKITAHGSRIAGIAQQIRLLHRISKPQWWRHHHALVFKDRPDTALCLAKGEVLDIVAEPRRIANRIVEESMISALTFCAGAARSSSVSVFTTYIPRLRSRECRRARRTAENTWSACVDAEEVLTLEGFCKLRRELDAQPLGFLDSRIRRFQSLRKSAPEAGAAFRSWS